MRFADLAKPQAWQDFRENGVLHIPRVIDPDKISALRSEAYRVFHDVASIAPQAYRGNGRSGFSPPGIEGVAGKRADYGRQFWDVHLDKASDGKACDHTRELVRRMQDVTQELSVVMSEVFLRMEQGLGPLAAGMHQVMVKGWHGLRATHYPPVPRPADDILFPAHRDFSLVTVFVGGAEPGLQINTQGSWQDLENPLGDIALIAGGMLRYWTGGTKHPDRIGGLRHRVVYAADERLSLSFFTEPEPNTILPYSDGITAGEYIDRFVSATRAVT